MGVASAADRQLVTRLLAGDEAAFDSLVQMYHGPLVRLARVFVASAAIAEEVAQETWLAVFEGLARFEGRSSLKTWIFRILTNRAKTRGVREGRSIPFSSLGGGGAGGEATNEAAADVDRFYADGRWRTPPRRWDADVPERLLLDKEARTVIDAAVAKLPDSQRAVILLRDFEGCSSEDVCALLAVSEGNQRVLLHRARARVRRALEAYLAG